MIKQTLASLAVTVIMATPATAQQAMKMQMPEGKDVTITGTVIDVSCKFGQGLSGAEHKMCSEVCADRGLPLAVLGSDGVLYIPTSAGMPGDGQNARMKEFAEQVVTIKGKVFKAGGAQALQIASITKKS